MKAKGVYPLHDKRLATACDDIGYVIETMRRTMGTPISVRFRVDLSMG